MMNQDMPELALALFKGAGEALFLLDLETEQLIDANPVAERLTGIRRTDFLPCPLSELFRCEKPGGLERLCRACPPTEPLPAQDGFQIRTHQSGVWLPVNVSATSVKAGPGMLGLITVRDGRALREAGAHLTNAESELQRVLTSVACYLWSGFFDTAGQFHLEYVSSAVESVLGYPAGSDWAALDPDLQRLHPDDRQRVRDAIALLRDGQPLAKPLDFRIVRPDGTVSWLRDRITLSSAGPGRRSQLDGIVTDITSLRASEDRYRYLFETNLAGVFRVTWDGRVLDCNTALARILGFESTAELTSRSIWECYFDSADRRQFLSRILAANGVLTNYEHQQRRKDGTPIWILENVCLVEENGERIIEGTVIDITERKAAEDALRASEAKYRVLIENLEQSIFLKDGDFRFRAANRRFSQGLGLSEKELIGKTDFDLFPKHLADKYRSDDLTVILEDRRLEVEEQTFVDGRPRIVRVVKTPVKDASGRMTGVLGIFWDVTDQRALEAQLRQAQKMDALGQLAGGVAHDFNNLLTAILGNLALVLAGLADSDPHRELIVAAEKAALRSADLVRKLLGFSRRSLLRLEPLDIRFCVRETLDLLRPAIDPRIGIDVQIAVDAWTVQADAGQVNQVLLNLCINARDAMPEGGMLRIAVDNTAVDDVYVRNHMQARLGDFLRIRVQDSGLGMPPEVRARIFEPFFTTKGPGKGLGLGLAMVFTIVEQHRGWLDCQSEAGEGTTFDVYLPRYLPPSVAKPAPPVPRGPCWGNETILLVEDEAILRHLGAAILQRYGYQVLVAEDGVRALEVYQSHQEQIDLVFLDLTMPRLSGRDTFLQLAAMNPQVRVLFTSGYTSEPPVVGEPGQVLGFLGKPYRPEDLALTIRSALDQAKEGKRHLAQRDTSTPH